MRPERFKTISSPVNASFLLVAKQQYNDKLISIPSMRNGGTVEALWLSHSGAVFIAYFHLRRVCGAYKLTRTRPRDGIAHGVDDKIGVNK